MSYFPNAASATKLATARNINGVAFDGSADILLSSAGQWGPSDHGLIAWAYEPAAVGGTQAPVSGTVWVVKLKITAATTITNVLLNVGVIGATLTAGQCFAGLYQGGTLLAATADQASSWTSLGIKTMALSTPQAVSAGTVQVAYFSNGTTNPAFARSSTNANTGNVALSSSASRYATADTGRTTTFPATLGTMTANTATIWAAVS